MTELDKTTTVEKGIPKLTEEQLTKLKNGETVEIPYSYTKPYFQVFFLTHLQ